MEKFNAVGFNTRNIERILSREFTLSKRKPNFIVSHGGDGTLLHSERLYPGIPKLPIRSSEKCGVCAKRKTASIHFATGKIYCESALKAIIARLKRGDFAVEEISKVKATAFCKRGSKRKSFALAGMNEVQIHNASHAHAIRFEFCLNGACIEKEIIGDGIVASTTHGSTAYFYAITRRKFSKGFGIAFNNTIRQHKPLFLKGKFKAEMRIHRRHAALLADNNPKTIALREGDKVVIEPAKEKARIIKL